MRGSPTFLTALLPALLGAGLAAVGGAVVVLGELDDSPGLGGLGLLLVLAVALVWARSVGSRRQ